VYSYDYKKVPMNDPNTLIANLTANLGLIIPNTLSKEEDTGEPIPFSS
jgi:hypothetical protein